MNAIFYDNTKLMRLNILKSIIKVDNKWKSINKRLLNLKL